MSTYTGGLSSSKAFYRVTEVAAEFCKAAQLYVFISGTQYLSLGVLRHVFGVQYAVSVLVTSPTCVALLHSPGVGELTGCGVEASGRVGAAQWRPLLAGHTGH